LRGGKKGRGGKFYNLQPQARNEISSQMIVITPPGDITANVQISFIHVDSIAHSLL
jgi:hypothetical protein